MKSSQQAKIAAVTAYITIVGTLIAYFMNNDDKNPFASFHIRQAFGIHIVFYLLGLLVSMFNSWFISAPFYIFIFIMLAYGLVMAIQGKAGLVPWMGVYFQKWFKSLK